MDNSLVKLAFIRKMKGKWCVYSHKKSKNGKRRNFGCYPTKEEAKKRLGQLYFFKGQGAIDSMVEIANDLDKKGMLHFAEALMDCLEKITSISLGDEMEKRPSITLGKIASLLEKKNELELAQKLDALLPIVLDVENGIECPECPSMSITADLGQCNITKQMSADKLYDMASCYQKMYQEGLVDESSFEYRKFRELRYLLKSAFAFLPPEGQEIPTDAANWWDHFEAQSE